MSLDTTRLGVIAAGMMESLAESYADQDVEVGEVVLLVELRGGDNWTAVAYRCTDNRSWIQAGLMQEGCKAVEASRRTTRDDGE